MKHLILFITGRLDDMLAKGNVWYVKHYERYFDKVTVVYLTGSYPHIVRKGKTKLISVGTNQYLFDLIVAPFKLFKIVRRVKPSSLLTADILYGWWTTILLRLLMRKKINLMPVCHVHTIYPAKTGFFLPWLPRWIERGMLDASFWMANKIILNKHYPELNKFFLERGYTRRKIQFVDVLVEEYPTVDFYQLLNKKFDYPKQFPKNDKPILLSVARLFPDKLMFDLLEMLSELVHRNIDAHLILVGEGPLKIEMENRAKEMSIEQNITFLGAMLNSDLVPLYQHSTLVVSTLMGTSLREAALCGVPIVCYRNAVVNDILENDKTAYLAHNNSPLELANQVEHALKDPEGRKKIGRNIQEMARAFWGTERLSSALQTAFEQS